MGWAICNAWSRAHSIIDKGADFHDGRHSGTATPSLNLAASDATRDCEFYLDEEITSVPVVLRANRTLLSVAPTGVAIWWPILISRFAPRNWDSQQ